MRYSASIPSSLFSLAWEERRVYVAKDMRGMGGRIWGMRRIKIEKGPR